MKVVDLFCGAGGLSKGFEMAGFEVILGIDHFEPAIDTFRKNHPKAVSLKEDIRTVDSEKIKSLIGNQRVDVIVGGPPCQGFSMAGERDPHDPRNALFKEFVRIVDQLKPNWFVMENVTGILVSKTANGERVSDIIKSEFSSIGYRVEFKTLLSADYGVPQKRKRVIFIGTRTGHKIEFPMPTHSEIPYISIDERKIKRWVPVSSVLLSHDEVEEVYFHSQKMIDGFLKRKANNTKNGKGFGWQILKDDQPSYTISARYWKDGSDALVKYTDTRIRMLTELECARIQTFPDDYIFCGGKKARYIQIGNAVPPLLARAIAENIKKNLDQSEMLITRTIKKSPNPADMS